MMFKKTIDINDYFRGDLIGSLIPGFPYPERHCPFCERELSLLDAIHCQDSQENFKALYICFNPVCGAYDEAARKAYSRVYYSSNEAFERLEMDRVFVSNLPRKN